MAQPLGAITNSSRGLLDAVTQKLKVEKCMKDIGIKSYYVGEDSCEYAGDTSFFVALNINRDSFS